MPLLDILTILSYVALNIDIIFQILRIWRTKSSNDISLIGLTIRYVAVLVILFKFMSLSDLPLIIGQSLITVTITLYLLLAISYRMRRRAV